MKIIITNLKNFFRKKENIYLSLIIIILLLNLFGIYILYQIKNDMPSDYLSSYDLDKIYERFDNLDETIGNISNGGCNIDDVNNNIENLSSVLKEIQEEIQNNKNLLDDIQTKMRYLR